MTTLKCFLEDSVNHKSRVHQLYFIRYLLQEKFKNGIFVKLDSKYAAYFPEYLSYSGRSLRLMKPMYGMTNSRKLFTYYLK